MTLPRPTMDELLARGQAAYKVYLARRVGPPLIGVTSVSVVTRKDFDRYVTMCREYATHTRLLHILDDQGRIEVIVGAAKRGDQ